MIQPRTFSFLKELTENNNREWFMANKDRYETARENVIDFTAEFIKELQKIDPQLDKELEAKKCIMRIYRDIRFSKDKTPYKTNFGISIPTHGQKAGRAEYFLHLASGNSFIAGGYWMPQADHLKAIRQEIDYNGQTLKAIIEDKEFAKLFGDFTTQDQLKNLPKEYSADNENIKLLKLKSFVALHNLTEAELMESTAPAMVASICKRIAPLNEFINNALA